MNTRRGFYLLILAVVLALGVLAGCSRKHNDAQIAGEVVSKIQADANVPTKQIAVTANNGVVTLSGTVGSELERVVAANDAAQVEGVKTVINNLQVTPAVASVPAQVTPVPQPEEQPAKKEPARAQRSSSSRRPSTYEASAPASTAAMTPSAPVPAAAPAAPPKPAPPRPVTIPEGTILSIRMIDSVDSDRNQPGDRFRATLDSPITIDDKVIVPQGADIQGRVAELKSSGHFTGKSEIALELVSLSVNGRKYTLQTNQYSREGTSRGKRTAATVGGGAALGAIIGAIAGGGKGAAIGATVGAGAGTGVQAATKGQQIHVPSEALLSFRLESPLTVTPVSSIQRGERNFDRTTEYSDSLPPETSDDPNAPVLKRR